MAALGELVAGVAHELNNPLTFVYSGVSLIGSHCTQLRRLLDAYEAGASPEEVAQLRKEIHFEDIMEDLAPLVNTSLEGANRMKKIVQNLRNFSRLDDFTFHQVDVRAAMESTLGLVQANYKHKIRFHTELAEVPPLAGSLSHLGQVFMNLLVNACQAIQEQGDIWVSVKESEGAVVVEVRDNGQGMTPEVCRRIFEPFFTTKPVGEGTGLGLSLCYGIVEKHGGRIDVESMVARGSCFRLTFPLNLNPSEVPHA